MALFVASFALPLAALDYTWNPGNATTGNTDDMHGDGFFATAPVVWWNGTTNVAAGGGSAPFGNGTGGVAENANLWFYGNGTLTRNSSGTTYFVTGSANTDGQQLQHSMNFAAGSSYAITSTATDDTVISIGNNALFAFNLGAGSSLSISGSADAWTELRSGYTGSASTAGWLKGISATGGGTLNLNSRAAIRFTSERSSFRVTGGTKVNFNTGSLFTASNGTPAAGSLDSATPSLYFSRIFVDEGTLTINGGSVYTGYAGGGAGAVNGNGVMTIGAVNSAASPGEAVVNLQDGKLVAIGNPRYANGTNTSLMHVASGGINFGAAISNKGGTFNMTGGTLEVSHITGWAQKANVIFNGGTVVVSTAISSNESTSPSTNADLQRRLDNFIDANFNASSRNIFVGNVGLTVDTGQIDTTRTNGIATINSPLKNMTGDRGNLTKVGTNTLLLKGDNLINGTAHIQGGTLAISSTGNISRFQGFNIAAGATLDVSAYATYTGFTVGSHKTIAGAGTIKGNIETIGGAVASTFAPDGTLTIDGDFSAGLGTTFRFDTLGTDVISVTGTLTLGADAVINLANANVAAGQSYDLFFAGSAVGNDFVISGASDFLFDINNNGTVISITARAIPEPSSYAVLLALGTLSLMLWRRRE